MSRSLAIGVCLVGFVGLVLLFSEMRWCQRIGLVDRLREYTVTGRNHVGMGLLSVASFREVLVPMSRSVGERLAKLFRVGEELDLRLERIHSPVDVTGFRVRQVGWATLSCGAALIVSVAAGVNVLLALGAIAAAPVLAFLILEQKVAKASQQWQQRIRMELPVITEQIGMLLAAGWSLGATLARVGERGAGACALDLERVSVRIRQGLSEIEALREWANRADVDSLYRLVSVLSLNQEAADLGGLISEEARAMRKDAQRDLIETIERRTQQVWIPVTAATLVPGVMLMGVPFVDALTLFSV